MRKLLVTLVAALSLSGVVAGSAQAHALPLSTIHQGGALGSRQLANFYASHGFVPTLRGEFNCHRIGPHLGSCVSYVNLLRTDGGRARCSAQTFVKPSSPGYFLWKLMLGTVHCYGL